MPNHESFVVNLPNEVSVTTLMKQVEQWTGLLENAQLMISDGRVLNPRQTLKTYNGQEFWVELKTHGLLNGELIPKTSIGYRNYHSSLKKDEKRDIHFILKNLATKSLVSLLYYQFQLKRAGKRIDHIHPLQFLLAVFTNEEMKVHIYNVKKRGGWVWSDFMKGLGGSLQDESKIGNMKDSYLKDFAKQLGISVDLISGLITSHQWEKLVKTLVTSIPRKGGSGRYGQ